MIFNKTRKKFCLMLAVFIFITAIAAYIPIVSLAAPSVSASVKFSSSQDYVVIGNEVKATVTFTTKEADFGGVKATIKYDASVLEFVSGDNVNGGAGVITLVDFVSSAGNKSFTVNLIFRAKKAGLCTLMIEESEVYSFDEIDIGNATASASIKVLDSVPKSNNANVKSLKISAGTLSPKFSKNVTEYTVSVPYKTTKCTVEAIVEHSGAKVTETKGFNKLSVGKNTCTITVTAEDGVTVKKYTVVITRQEDTSTPTPPPTPTPTINPALFTDYEGEQWFLSQDIEDVSLPTGFDEGSVEFNGVSVAAGIGKNGMVIVNLVSADKTKSQLVIYENSKFSPFVQFTSVGGKYIILGMDAVQEIPYGYEARTMELSAQKVTVWVLVKDSTGEVAPGVSPTPSVAIDPIEDGIEFCLIYAQNTNGDRGFYLYDIKEGTMQRWYQDGYEATLPTPTPVVTPTPEITPTPTITPTPEVTPTPVIPPVETPQNGIDGFLGNIFGSVGALVIAFCVALYVIIVLIIAIVILLVKTSATRKALKKAKDAEVFEDEEAYIQEPAYEEEAVEDDNVDLSDEFVSGQWLDEVPQMDTPKEDPNEQTLTRRRADKYEE